MDELCDQLKVFHISARLQRLAEEEELALKQDNAWFLNELPFVCNWPERGLPTLDHGCRPCWEPLILDYSWFKVVMEAQKELNAREGSREIGWRTDILDQDIAYRLQVKYDELVSAIENDAKARCNMQEVLFWENLGNALGEDMQELLYEGCDIMVRHGKTIGDWDKLTNQIDQIAKARDPNLRGSMWDFLVYV